MTASKSQDVEIYQCLRSPPQPRPWRRLSFSGGRMRVLVTGGAGYIGSHTAKILAKSGFKPIVLDNLSFGHRWAVKWGPLEEGDLCNTDFVRTVLKKHAIEAVIHFAANAYVGESVHDPKK